MINVYYGIIFKKVNKLKDTLGSCKLLVSVVVAL